MEAGVLGMDCVSWIAVQCVRCSMGAVVLKQGGVSLASHASKVSVGYVDMSSLSLQCLKSLFPQESRDQAPGRKKVRVSVVWKRHGRGRRSTLGWAARTENGEGKGLR